MLHRCIYVFLGFNKLIHWGRKIHVNWRRSSLVKIIISTSPYLNQNSADPLVPDHQNFTRTSKYLHLLVPMSTNISASCWWRTYWVLRCSNFCLGLSKCDNLVDQSSVKLSAILSQPPSAWCHEMIPLVTQQVCVTFWLSVISFNLFTKLQIKTIFNPLCLCYMVYVYL